MELETESRNLKPCKHKSFIRLEFGAVSAANFVCVWGAICISELFTFISCNVAYFAKHFTERLFGLVCNFLQNEKCLKLHKRNLRLVPAVRQLSVELDFVYIPKLQIFPVKTVHISMSSSNFRRDTPRPNLTTFTTHYYIYTVGHCKIPNYKLQISNLCLPL